MDVETEGVDASVTVTSQDVTPVTGPPCGTPGFLTLDPNFDSEFNAYLCPGQTNLIAASARSATARGLTRNVAYRFAVVAEDMAGNRSTLAVSETCVSPTPGGP